MVRKKWSGILEGGMAGRPGTLLYTPWPHHLPPPSPSPSLSPPSALPQAPWSQQGWQPARLRRFPRGAGSGAQPPLGISPPPTSAPIHGAQPCCWARQGGWAVRLIPEEVPRKARAGRCPHAWSQSPQREIEPERRGRSVKSAGRGGPPAPSFRGRLSVGSCCPAVVGRADTVLRIGLGNP